MSVRDLTSQLQVQIGLTANFTTDTTLFTAAIDMSDFDPGFMFSMAALTHSAGSYVLSLQESKDGSVFTDIPAEKLIDPGTSGVIVVDSQVATNDILERLGAFSTDRFVRGKIISAGVSGSNVITVTVTKMAELVPVVTQ